MYDFVVRESKFILNGPMAICHYGYMGSIDHRVTIGDVIIGDQGSVMVTTNYDALLDPESTEEPYRISEPVYGHEGLLKCIRDQIAINVKEGKVKSGLIVTTDSYFGP